MICPFDADGAGTNCYEPDTRRHVTDPELVGRRPEDAVEKDFRCLMRSGEQRGAYPTRPSGPSGALWLAGGRLSPKEALRLVTVLDYPRNIRQARRDTDGFQIF